MEEKNNLILYWVMVVVGCIAFGYSWIYEDAFVMGIAIFLTAINIYWLVKEYKKESQETKKE